MTESRQFSLFFIYIVVLLCAYFCGWWVGNSSEYDKHVDEDSGVIYGNRH